MNSAADLDAFANLAEAVGLTEGGELKGSWFEDPIGRADGTRRGLSSIVYNNDQREALMSFVDDVLGPPESETQNEAVWLPLFSESGATIFAVVKAIEGSVRVGFGVEYETVGATPSVALRAHVPIFQLPREGGVAPDVSGSLPDWSLLGREGGCIELSLDINISNDSPVAGELFLGGVFLSACIPTTESDTFNLTVGFRRLQLPGTSTPRDLDLSVDSLADLDSDVLEFFAGLLQAQAEALDSSDSATAAFSALSALLGLRAVASIPSFPLEALINNGATAVLDWLESIFSNNAARDAWLGELASLLGGSVNTSRDSIEFSTGPLTSSVGIRIAPATGGGIIINPWLEVALRPRAGAEVRLSADVLTADTTNGEISALPNLLCTAVFGRDAGSPNDLLDGDPGIGSVHAGFTLSNGNPAFTLTAHNVTLASTSHALLDLSSPDAALNAASNVVDAALLNVLNDLGRPGELAAILIGLDPPAGITELTSSDILRGPIPALRDYWAALLADPDAFREVVAAARELLTGVDTPLTGSGTEDAPLLVEITPVNLMLWREGNEVCIDIGVSIASGLNDELQALFTVRAALARLNVITPSATFLSKLTGSLVLQRIDQGTSRFDLGSADLLAESIGVELAWAARGGLSLVLLAPGLLVELDSFDGTPLSIEIPMPIFNSDGTVSFAPDWSQVELLIAELLGRSGSDIIDSVLGLVGWGGEGGSARLSLADLIDNPALALRAWLAQLVLDCDNVRYALSPLAALLSGFRLSTPLGSGNERDPFRTPIAGEHRAPGTAVWFEPGCSLSLGRNQPRPGFFDSSKPPEEGELLSALHSAAKVLPDIKDLLIGRESLEQGLRELAERFTGTDGLIGRPISLPDNVNGIDLLGYSYRELVALGAIDSFDSEIFDTAPDAIIYIGCEELWATNFAANSIDARSSTPAQTVASTADGRWSLALPLAAQAAADRPDRGAVGEQAARISAALAGRTSPITVVAFGAAGAAAINAANSVNSITRVVTVGSPWADLAISGFTAGLSADALRLIRQIRRPIDAQNNDISEELIVDEAGSLLQMSDVVDRALNAATLLEEGLSDLPADMPNANDQERRDGLIIDAVFGLLNEDEVTLGLAELLSDSIEYRYEIFEDPPQPPDVLRAGLDVPVIDLNLGGVLIGAGATLELVSFDRGASGDNFEIHNQQQVILDLHFGVHDGWLVGGPGAVQNDVEVRWLSARIKLPLGDNPPSASASLVLHEASCFGVQRERWVIDIDADGVADTLPNSEVHIMLEAVVTKLSAVSNDFAELLEQFGLIRAGGYDPQGLDRLVFDTASTIANGLNADVEGLARLIRNLSGFGGSGSVVSWDIDSASLSLDLQMRSIQVGLLHTLPGLPTIGADLTLNTNGIMVNTTVGDIAPALGGIALKASLNSAIADDIDLRVCWQLPGASTASEIGLLPLTKTDELLSLVAAVVPSMLAVNFLTIARSRVEQEGREAIDTVLDSLALLAPATEFGGRRVLLPWMLFIKPEAWLRNAASAWGADPFGQAVMVLEALAPLIAPTRTTPGWPLSENVRIDYKVESGRLNLSFDVSAEHALDSVDMALSVLAGVSIDSNGTVLPLLSSSLRFDERGLELDISPSVQLSLLRAAPAAPIAIYPGGPGLGALLETGVSMAIPVALNALIAQRNNASASLQRDVARVVFDVSSALDLLESDQFSEAKISTFSADPIRGLTSNLGQLASVGISNLATTLDPNGNLVVASNDGVGRTRVSFGASANLSIVLDGGSLGPALELSGNADINGLGSIDIELVRLSLEGVQLAASFVATNLDIGNGLMLMPIASVKAGVSSAGFERLIGVGLATDGIGDQSIEFRWALNNSPPRVVVVNRTVTAETEDNDIENVALAMLSLVVPMAVNITLKALDPLGPKIIDVLQNVAFIDGTANLDPQLIADFKDPVKLLDRAYQLAFNLASENIKITIDGKVEVGFTGNASRAGVFVSLAPGQSIALGNSDPSVALEIVASWINAPGVSPGLSIFLLQKSGNTFSLNPSFAVAGLGVRVAKTSGPLLDLGIMAIDAIGVHVYGEVAPAGIGAGVHVQLDGLAFTPSAAGGDNGVANNIMSDAADSASPSTRPAFSPSLAIQKAPGGDVGITLRAGDPPGPWWVGVQRQLGPLYLEQFGFNVVEQDGSITGMSLLFDARISLFGLNAEVDQLGLHWQGGDAFDLENWAVDLQGLAVSGDFAGLSISGGLLKTNLNGSVGYVGMLMGRFGVYGLSLFGGYSDDDGLPSFFVFGAIQGPIGGPPAFFLTGIGGGLGIKRGLRVPDDLSKFGDYPFIKALDPAASVSQNPLQELRQLAEYFPPEPGNMWFAAGISFTSFALVDGVAVVAVSFGNGLDVNLFGLARLALPRPQAALVSIELGLLARFSSSEGLFLIQAQLTDNSWLLYPEVRLTGGFAFATWWKGPNTGQFVLTLGGYHPSFSRAGYPVVPRLGLEWRVTDDIVIKGGSYFALTSEALMAGIAIEVSADFGFVWAKIAFGADGIVYFDPFFFSVDAYARIAAGIKIKTFFGTIRISISLGATVHVEGPSFNGRATIEVGPADITVPFGNPNSPRGAPLDWVAFVPKYLEQVRPGQATVVSGVSGKGSLPAATDGDTSAPSSDGSIQRPFEVFSEFEITIVTTVPTKVFDFGNSTNNRTVQTKLSDGRTYDLGLSPMNAAELNSILEVRLSRKQGPNQVWVDRTPTHLQRLVENMVKENGSSEGPSYGVEAFPIGVWGAPKDPQQPSEPLPTGDVVFAGNRLKLVAKASVEGKTGPPIDYYRVESGRRPLPLTAKGSSRLSVLNKASGLGIGEFASTTNSAFELAETQLFREHAGSVVDGLINQGQRSATARASYVRSRNAPPLFGTLTEGLAAQNDRRAETETTPPKVLPAIPPQRAPFITGYMVGGAGVTTSSPTTSVSNAKIKRRPAPSLDSVQGRLGRSLPIKLTSAAAPSLVSDKTVLVRGSVPFTNLGGVARSYRGGHIGSTVGGALVTGLNNGAQPNSTRRSTQPRGLEQGSRIRAGDIVAMRLPDAATDLSDARPSLFIEGSARVVMLKGNGLVALDKRVNNASVEMPKCVANIAVQADGGASLDDAKNVNVVGWHDQSQLSRLGGRSAIGADCVVNVEGAAGAAKVGWTVACDLVRDAATVTTRLNSTVRTIGVIVRGAQAQRLEDMGVELSGAERIEVNGRPVEPAIVQAGPRSIMIFEVRPLSVSSEIFVRITAGGTRQIAGVIGAVMAAEQLSDLLAEQGLVALVTRLRAVSGNGCVLRWQPAADQPSPPSGEAANSSGSVTTGSVAQPGPRASSLRKKAAKKNSVKASRKKTSKRSVTKKVRRKKTTKNVKAKVNKKASKRRASKQVSKKATKKTRSRRGGN